MDSARAQKVVEDLRIGIPPDGHVCQFTVGRKHEIDSLNGRLNEANRGALLLKANYGSGKTHLLRYVKERALEEKYVVSSVTLDAKSAVRFNRMDQILGAIWRGMELPNGNGGKGIRPFLNEISEKIDTNKSRKAATFWKELTNDWHWDLSGSLESPALFVAVRAWSTKITAVCDLIEDWFYQPWNYRAQRKQLYVTLVEQLRNFFRDPRPEWKFYADQLFEFHVQGYSQCWAVLRDIHLLSTSAGFKGFIILFDEFEDVIHNIKNVNHQEAAFWNLFEFYMGNEFRGMTYFAVTPDFVKKCKRLLMNKGRWDYDYSMFDKIPTFAMSPLTTEELQELAIKILDVHGIAYDWEPDTIMKNQDLQAIVAQAATVQVQDRARQTIKEIVKHLDRLFEDME